MALCIAAKPKLGGHVGCSRRADGFHTLGLLVNRLPHRAPNRLEDWKHSGSGAEHVLPVAAARQAADQAQARYHELQRRNDAMIERRRDAIDRGDLMQSRRLAPEHRQVIQELRNAAHEWNLAVARLLDAELNERGY